MNCLRNTTALFPAETFQLLTEVADAAFNPHPSLLFSLVHPSLPRSFHLQRVELDSTLYILYIVRPHLLFSSSFIIHSQPTATMEQLPRSTTSI